LIGIGASHLPHSEAEIQHLRTEETKMKARTLALVIAIILSAITAAGPQLMAQQQATTHYHYKLVDLGTFGGPQSYTISTALLSTGLELNNSGVLVGYADTKLPDPAAPLCFVADCFVAYPLRWQDGVISHLSSLHQGWSSAPVAVSANGLIAGYSENGKIDPLTATAELRAVLWENGRITNLGTLPEGGYESAALSVNSAGQVAGSALNTTADPTPLFLSAVYPMVMQTTQSRAFFWEGDVMQDLGTLGGTDAAAALINERGQVMGWSYTGAAAGACNPALGSFIWDKEKGMRSVGSFGGTCAYAFDLNNGGQVVGWSSVTGDQYSRAFVSKDGLFQDLGGSIGGNSTFAFAINESGQAVGGGQVGGDSSLYFHAALWTQIGQMTDLGTLGKDPCSSATDINARGQVVGGSISHYQCLHEELYTRAFLWENGGIVDLNALIPDGSPLYLLYADHINDEGEIAGNGVDADGNNHAFLLIPCDENHPNVAGCDYSTVDTTHATLVSPPAIAPRTAISGRANPSRPMLPERLTLSRLRGAANLAGPLAGNVQQNLGTTPKAAIARDIEATQTHVLTGMCFATCRKEVLDLEACPKGQIAKSPAEAPMYPCGPVNGEVPVDGARKCTVFPYDPNGHCVTN
jgi:probable HAF family extracellular repeat protein